LKIGKKVGKESIKLGKKGVKKTKKTIEEAWKSSCTSIKKSEY
jgi:hypothetical protein